VFVELQEVWENIADLALNIVDGDSSDMECSLRAAQNV
jgi:hypothetical protein